MQDMEKEKNFEDALMEMDDATNQMQSKNTKKTDESKKNKFEEQKVDLGLTKKGKPRKRAAPGSPNAKTPRKRNPPKKRT